MKNTLVITRPDDWHLHLRDEELLNYTVKATAKHFSRALIMPNLKSPLVNLDELVSYFNRIIKVTGKDNFKPYLTFYLNKSSKPQDFKIAKENYNFILGAKLYPSKATTNSSAGVKSVEAIYPMLEVMQDLNFVLQIHGEVTHGDIFSREEVFIKEKLIPIIKNFPKLRIVLEHISTEFAVNFVSDAPENLAATITPHHLMYNRNDLLAGGLRPHYYCLPILKSKNDQDALKLAAFSGNPKFFAGTDSAPHLKSQKESACACAGVYTAPFAVNLYAEVFSQNNKLEKLNNFMSKFGAEFYQLPINKEKIELKFEPFVIPDFYSFGKENVIPIGAGSKLCWSINGTKQ